MAESALSLVDRLRTALDRAEEIARAAWTEPGHGEWRVTAGGGLAQGPYMMLHPHQVEGMLGSRALAHIAANGPAPVLRTVAAHRKIIDAFVSALEREAHWKEEHIEKFIAWSDHEVMALRYAVEALAAVYFPEAPDA